MAQIDRAIAVLKESNLSVEVGPFGTAVEGEWTDIQDAVSRLVELFSEENETLLNLQYHFGDRRLSNAEKVEKHRL